MISAAEPPKRMVSSVFITLASPYRATVTPSSHIHSSKGRDGLSSGLPLSPGYGTSEPQLAKRRPSAASQDGNSCSTAPSLASPLASQPTSVPTSPNTTADNTRRSCSGGSTKQAVMAQITPSELSPPPPPETAFPEVLPPPPPETAFPELSPDPSSPQPSRGLSSIPSLSGGPLRSQASSPAVEAGAPVGTQLVDRHPSGGSLGNEQLQTRLANPGSDLGPESKELCGFCRKTVALSEPAIDALNRTYHSSCFQCRQCNVPLAGKLYYNKAGIPLCEDCYQASLEPCWACGEVIKDHVIRALERAYHPPCFVCTTCRQPIGEQRFAQGEVGEVYCLQDYYRKYAPECSACKQLIIPREDGTDSYTVECLGQSFHEDCYRCEVCRTVLCPEPNDQGCHPLDNRILCKPCHLSLVQRAQ